MSGSAVRPAPPRAASAAIFTVLALFFVVVRWRLSLDDFANPDIAGIAYNADLLRRGELPWIDSLELKAQGAAFLWAAWWAVFGRSVEAIHVLYAVWVILGAAGTGLAAAQIWSGTTPAGETGAPLDAHTATPPGARDGASSPSAVDDASLWAAAVAAGLHLAFAGMFDFNYAAWMVTPYTWTFAFALTAWRGGRVAPAVASGACLAIAVTFKQHALVIVAVLALGWVVARRRRWPGGRSATALACAVGVVLGFAPISALYAGTSPLFVLHALFPVDTLKAYGAGGEATWSVELVTNVALQHLRTFPLPLAMIGAGIAASRLGPASHAWHVDTKRAVWLAIAFWAVSLAACAAGGLRFYLHYLVQQLPALAILAADPRLPAAWPAMLRRDPSSTGSPPRRLAALALSGGLTGAALAWHAWELATDRADRYDTFQRRLPSGVTAPRAAGDFIRARSTDRDTIQVWGWSAWPTYFWAQRRAPTRVYKVLGVLTEFNGNSAFDRGGGVRLREGPALETFAREFRADPPRFFVYSPSFVTTFASDHDPLDDFTALRDQLRGEYAPVAAFGDLTVLQRRDPPP